MSVESISWQPINRQPTHGERCVFEVLDSLQPPGYTGDIGHWDSANEEFHGPQKHWIVKAASVKRWISVQGSPAL